MRLQAKASSRKPLSAARLPLSLHKYLTQPARSLHFHFNSTRVNTSLDSRSSFSPRQRHDATRRKKKTIDEKKKHKQLRLDTTLEKSENRKMTNVKLKTFVLSSVMVSSSKKVSDDAVDLNRKQIISKRKLSISSAHKHKCEKK